MTSRALRVRAIFLPGGVVLLVWLLNVMALRTGFGPRAPGFWMVVFVVASVFLVWRLAWNAVESGASVWGTALTAVAATIVWFMLSNALPDLGKQPDIKVGDRGSRPGGGFTMSISREFQRPQLESLLARAEQFGPSGAFADFSCGDAIPDFRFELTLRPAGEWNERLVSVAYTPRLDAGGAQRCMSFGLSYLFDIALAEIDYGPPIDYGYVDPHTGKPLGPYQPGPPRKPICRCDLQHAGREWVAWSEKGAAELR